MDGRVAVLGHKQGFGHVGLAGLKQARGELGEGPSPK